MYTTLEIMNAAAIYDAEKSWSRRSSTETIYSIQGKETDIARDTSDTSSSASDTDVGLEYEPASEPEEEPPFNASTSADSDNAIIETKVVRVSIEEDGDVWAADSEWTETYESDSEIDLNDYWQCAQCHADNNNPLYRYCQKCFEVRKNLFPPRPKRKKRATVLAPEQAPQQCSQDSGIDSQATQPSSSQEVPQDRGTVDGTSQPEPRSSLPNRPLNRPKRRAESADGRSKRARMSESDDGSDAPVQPIAKTVSDPSISIDSSVQLTKKALSNSLKGNLEANELCVVCVSEPKSGVFVHGRIAHICCCYKCAMKVWAKAKRCPVCNCKVSNVLRAVVM